MVRRAPGPEINTPATMLHLAMDAAAEYAQFPDFTPESLLETLRLHTPEPDGYSLLDRLTGFDDTTMNRRPIYPFVDATRELVQQGNKLETNQAQEVILRSLGGVLCRQLTREDFICPLAKDIALSVNREDVIPPEIRTRLLGRSIYSGLVAPEAMDPIRLRHLLEEILGPIDGGGLRDQLDSSSIGFGVVIIRGDLSSSLADILGFPGPQSPASGFTYEEMSGDHSFEPPRPWYQKCPPWRKD